MIKQTEESFYVTFVWCWFVYKQLYKIVEQTTDMRLKWNFMHVIYMKWSIISLLCHYIFHLSDVFEASGGGKQGTRLMNILMQLRKCVNHPYLFDGEYNMGWTPIHGALAFLKLTNNHYGIAMWFLIYILFLGQILIAVLNMVV